MAGPFTYHGWTASTLTPGIPVVNAHRPAPVSQVSPTAPKTAGPATLGAHTILSTVFGPNYQKILGLAPGTNAGSQPITAAQGQPPAKPANNNVPTTTLTPQQLQTSPGQQTSGWIAPSSVTNMGLASLTPAAQASQNAITGRGVPNAGTKLMGIGA
jgi:hypothetical protein